MTVGDSTFFIFFGGALSLYTGFLISFCAEKTGGASYEAISYELYGQKGLIFTSFCNILCNVGFLISYVCLVSEILIWFIYKDFYSSNN